jgi:hypothetical protein
MHQEMFQHGTVAFAPLGQRHFQCAFERGGHALALVWIDDKKGAFTSRKSAVRSRWSSPFNM